MALEMTRDPVQLSSWLDERVSADPVRGTVLGTIRATVDAPGAQPWGARNPAGTALAARSQTVYPLTVEGVWSASELHDLSALLETLPHLAGVRGRPHAVEALASRLARPAHRSGQRLFRLDELIEPVGVPGRARPATVDDEPVLIEFYRGFGEDAGVHENEDLATAVRRALATGRPWLWTDASGQVVSLANRQAVNGGSARIGPVYTPRERRGHGYASAVTAAATRDILDAGAIPVLFTDLANPTANAIYPRLGYYPVEDVLLAVFG